MTDIFKKPGILITVAVAAVLVIGGVLYMVWRRLSLVEMKQDNSSSDHLSVKADISKLQNEVKNRDEKILELKDRIASLERQILEVKITGRSSKSAKKAKVKCDDESCVLDSISDAE